MLKHIWVTRSRWVLPLVLLCLLTFTFTSLSTYQWKRDSPQSLPWADRIPVQNSNVAAKRTDCLPVHKIAFMKTHKTASSTVQNILFRYGLDNNLNFVLPLEGNHLNDPTHPYIILEPFKVEWLEQKEEEDENRLPWHKTLAKDQLYDMFQLHTQWNYGAVSQLLGPKTVYITILRDPVDLFESLYDYSMFKSVLKLDLHEYSKTLNVSRTLHQHRVNQYLGLNQQLFDLGLPATELFDEDAAQAKIDEIDESFHLVMIAEKFAESMVLLANLLCWPLHMVTSLKINARKTDKKVVLSEEEKATLRAWQSGDQKLYEHFLAKFDKQIEKYGRDQMDLDLDRLDKLDAHVREKCVLADSDRDHMKKESLFRPFSPKVVAYKVREEIHECRLMGMAENSLVDLARETQSKRWNQGHNKS